MSSALFWQGTEVIVGFGIFLGIIGAFLARMPHAEDAGRSERIRKIVSMPYRVMLARRRQQVCEAMVFRRRSIANRNSSPIHFHSHWRS